MELLKTIVNLVSVLPFILPIAVNNLVVFGSEISCEVSEAANGSCTRTVNPCRREHDGERQQCFGDWPIEVPSNCPLVAGFPVGDCRNQHDENFTEVVPERVELQAYPIYPGPGQLYGLRVSWSPSSDFATDTNLQGYQIKLKYSDDRTSTAGCVCKTYTETEHNFTLNYAYGDPRQLRVTVTSYPERSDQNAHEQVFSTPKNCYDFPYDPIHCGPPSYREPSNIQIHSTLTYNGTMSARISWGPPQFNASTYPTSSEYPTPSTYYLYLIQWNTKSKRLEHTDTFIASNTEVVSIHSLDITDNVYLQVQAYVKCSGYGAIGFHGCGVRSQVLIPSPMSTSSLSSVTPEITPYPTYTPIISSSVMISASRRALTVPTVAIILPCVAGSAALVLVLIVMIVLIKHKMKGFNLYKYYGNIKLDGALMHNEEAEDAE